MKGELCSTIECPPSLSVVGFVSRLARDFCVLWRCAGILFFRIEFCCTVETRGAQEGENMSIFFGLTPLQLRILLGDKLT